MTNMMGECDLIALDKKRVLITGGASGIGFATAHLFASLGAKVIIGDLNQKNCNEASTKTRAVAGIHCDISDEYSVRNLIKETLLTVGGLDIAVNCAGVSEQIIGTKKQKLEDWQRVVDINLKGSFLFGREAAKAMTAGGSIIFVSSIAGIGAMMASNAYGVSKAGVAMMTKTMASDLARHNIRVNAVAPGYTATPMVDGLLEDMPFDNTIFTKRTPLARLAKPEEIARPIAFLVSPMASFITGVTLPVDGGWTAFGGAGDASW